MNLGKRFLSRVVRFPGPFPRPFPRPFPGPVHNQLHTQIHTRIHVQHWRSKTRPRCIYHSTTTSTSIDSRDRNSNSNREKDGDKDSAATSKSTTTTNAGGGASAAAEKERHRLMLDPSSCSNYLDFDVVIDEEDGGDGGDGGGANALQSDSIEQSRVLKDIRESVRALCKGFPGHYWRELEKNSSYPTEFVNALADAGYLSLLVPEKYGGSGLQLREACAVLEEIHRAGGNGGAAHAQMYMMATLLKHGSEAQKDAYLPGIADGTIRFQAFGVSEPNSGTDTLSMETTARFEPSTTSASGKGEYVISGQKMWTSRAQHSDLMLLLAKTSYTAEQQANNKKSRWLSAFLVDMKAAQEAGTMEIRPIDTMVNHSTCEVFFDDLRVPAESLIGNEGDGFKCILSSMNAERILIASECIGDARFFLDRAVEYANSRVVFNRPISQNQGIQFPIAEAYTATEAANLYVRAASALYTAGTECGAEANIAKYLASEASWKAGDTCMQTHGGNAFAKEYDIERKWREARLYRIAPISSNLILSYVGEKVLGMKRSY